MWFHPALPFESQESGRPRLATPVGSAGKRYQLLEEELRQKSAGVKKTVFAEEIHLSCLAWYQGLLCPLFLLTPCHLAWGCGFPAVFVLQHCVQLLGFV